MARPHALVIITLVGALVAPASSDAHAEVIDLPDTRAELTLDTRTWRAVSPLPATTGTSSGIVAAYATERERLAITRAQVPNIDAWRTKTRDAYIAQIERGLVDAGYKPRGAKLTTIEGVPVLDLEATVEKRSPEPKTSTASKSAADSRSRREPIVMRVILFRTYALAIALEGPPSSRSALRAIAKTFVPPPARPEGSP